VKTRIYVDTSVIGGCLDVEYRIHSRRLLEWFRRGKATAVLSDLTLLELLNAPQAVRAILDDIPDANKETHSMDDEATKLARAYLAARVLTRRQWLDAQHIALAAVRRVDLLVSWNFRHIVNLRRIHGYNSVNLGRGYPILEIRSPREVVSDERA